MLPDRWLSVDPGEDTGWAVWSGEDFVTHGTDKMWNFGDAVWEEALRQRGVEATVPDELRDDQHLIESLKGISLVVLENWALYPWKLRGGELDWDECRTARLIGSIYQACRFTGWDYEQQPAKIKERAVAAGAESLFSRPLHENRHANDATMHGVYRIALEKKAQWADLGQTSWTVAGA